MDNFGALVGAMLVVAIVGFLLFLVLRELYCWYWKINRIIEILEAIQSNTGRSPLGIGGSQGDIAVVQPSISPGTEICPFCKEPSSRGNSVCEHCHMQKR